MRRTVTLVAEVEPGQRIEAVDSRRGDHASATLGLNISEGQAVLAAVQARLVADQVKRHGERRAALSGVWMFAVLQAPLPVGRPQVFSSKVMKPTVDCPLIGSDSVPGTTIASTESGVSRARSNSKPARPYIWRLIVFSRFTCPSTGPLLQRSVRPPPPPGCRAATEPRSSGLARSRWHGHAPSIAVVFRKH